MEESFSEFSFIASDTSLSRAASAGTAAPVGSRRWQTRLARLWLVGLLFAFELPLLSAGPYNGGPGGPILIVTNSANPFAEYYAEIFLAEGLNSFALKGISAITNTTLTNYDLVILGEMGLTTTQVTTLSNWVNEGGSLIAMRPDRQLANLLGLVGGSSTISDGYLLVNTSNGPGVGDCRRYDAVSRHRRPIHPGERCQPGNALFKCDKCDGESGGDVTKRRRQWRAGGGIHL